MCILVITESEKKKIQRNHGEECGGIKDFMPMVNGLLGTKWGVDNRILFLTGLF